jgi:hypothetical protein
VVVVLIFLIHTCSRLFFCCDCHQALTAEEKQYYEREADKHNGMNPVDPNKDEDEEDDEIKRQQMHTSYEQAAYATHDMTGTAGYSHVHGGMHAAATQHDPRHHAYYYQQHGYYDYSAAHHHQQHGRARGHQQYQYPSQQGHGY